MIDFDDTTIRELTGLVQLIVLGLVPLLLVAAFACIAIGLRLRFVEKRNAILTRQKFCAHNDGQKYGMRVYSRPVRRLFRKQLWWVCPGCGAREPEVKGRHGKHKRA